MTVLGICGSASLNSSNLHLLRYFASKVPATVKVEIVETLQTLPLFSADEALKELPLSVLQLHEKIRNANLIVLSTPEYIFSVPAGLKNLLEWCVSTSVFSAKKVALLVASAQGEKTFAELKIIMRTIEAIVNDETCLLIQGVRGKLAADGTVTEKQTQEILDAFIERCLHL